MYILLDKTLYNYLLLHRSMLKSSGETKND
jgi:hypothetical protein